jgi:type II secretory pathway component PulJ
MSSAATVMARFLALAFFLVIALGIYVFVQNSDLQAAEQQVAQARQARDDLQLRIGALERSNTSLQQDLNACRGDMPADEE